VANPFIDRAEFAQASGQGVGIDAINLYYRLVEEEFDELTIALDRMRTAGETADTAAEIADACIDLMYVTIGLLQSMGLDPQPLWDEVHASNMSKFVRQEDGTYQAIRREDGKILKPATYFKPDLRSIVLRQARANP
jgi:predicted HAD superfamily Cof-like phosphohydrolase